MDDEYPSDDDLQKIMDWPPSEIMGLIAFVMSIWHWHDYAKLDGNKLELHTGGWSGNEDIIGVLMDTLFWMICWESSVRGGHYYFEIPDFIMNKDGKDGD